MNLEQVGRISGVEPAFAATHTGALWVFRGVYEVYACDERSQSPVWLAALDKDQHMFGPKLIFAAGDFVVTVEDFGARYRSRVVALALADGSVGWEQRFKLEVSRHGLALLDDRLLLYGDADKQGYRLLQLDAATGKTLATIAAHSGHTVCAVAGRIFLSSSNGLYVMERDEKELRPVMTVRPRVTSCDARALYVYEQGGGVLRSSVIYVDGQTAQEQGRFDQLDETDIVTRIIPLHEPGRVLIINEEGLARVIDVANGSLVSTLSVNEGWKPIGATATPLGPALLLASSLKRSVAVFEEQTGRVLAEQKADGGLPSTIFYLGERVVTCGSEILFFRLSEDDRSEPSSLAAEADAPVSTADEKRPESDAGLEETGAQDASDEQTLTEQQRQLKELLDLFIECMQAATDSEEHKECARRFNRRFQKYLDENPSESVGAFASRIASLGVPYNQAFSDLIRVRGLGSEA